MNTLKSLIILLLCVVMYESYAQKDASISETKQMLKTYPFSDPNPIPQPDIYFYPYYRFDGFALEAEDKEWKVVVLENDYIKLSVFPEIGGKIWGAIEKSTGNEFIYSNSVVKFRDIAMRGAWTSGGIEINMGIIGHAPSSATPVDYLIKKNDNGSVSCFVSAYDFFTRTRWETEINLQKDKAYFTTTTSWFNPTPLVQPYYQWMNAAYQVEGDLEFCFPGDSWIGHDGQAHSWPFDEEGRDRSWYKNNSFGGSKSNHVLGGISDHYAGYWHDLDFGSGHFSAYGEKLGMKVFQWAHSRSGGIWEDLLTDNDGQYVELQSGRLFNQAATNSTKTPFKHFGFEPYATDIFKEYWFPILNTKGVKKANPFGVLNIEKEENGQTIYYCPLQNTNEKLSIYFGDRLVEEIQLELKVLETWSKIIEKNIAKEPLRVVLGSDILVYSEKKEDNISNRPRNAPEDFDWDSAYGLFLDGQQWLYQNKFIRAEEQFKKCLEKDPYYAPALNYLAALYFRKADYDSGLAYASKSLSINTYDAEANFIYGLINKELGNLLDAQDGFSVASMTPSFRESSYVELCKLSFEKKDLTSAREYAEKILKTNTNHLEALKLMSLITRRQGKDTETSEYIKKIKSITKLSHFSNFEEFQLIGDKASKDVFLELIKCELPEESFLEMAQWYENAGSTEDAIQLLVLSPPSAMVLLKLAYLEFSTGDQSKSMEYLNKATSFSSDFVHPFRPENMKVLNWAVENSKSWKPKYYLALLNWKFGNDRAAMDLFTQCGLDPDAASFYLSKVQLFANEGSYNPETDLLKAKSIAPDQWRTSSMLIEHYLSKNEAGKALNLANEAVDRFPSNNSLKYAHAKSLMANEQYTACKEALANTVILPSEGARYGRVTYRQACLMEGISYYQNGKFNSAINSIASAKLWPENLGVGQPFDTDERIEKYFEAVCLMKKGKKKQANELFQDVIIYTQKQQPLYSSVDYLYLISLIQLQNESEANAYLDAWVKADPDNSIQKWCRSMIAGDFDQAAKIENQISTKTGGTPWDPKSADPEFEIVKSIATLSNEN